MPSKAEALRVGGLTPLTSIDFPGRLAAVVFLQGCPWRCSYCQNPALLEASAPAALRWVDVYDFLQRRRGLLDGVVFSGGEPTLQPALGDAIQAARALGFEAGLHTGGMYPDRLASLLPHLDWVGLDVKAPWARMDAVAGASHTAPRVLASLRHVLNSGVEHEIRTTWHPGLFSVDELTTLVDELVKLGVRRWALQECRTAGGPRVVLAPEQAQVFSSRFEHFTWRSA